MAGLGGENTGLSFGTGLQWEEPLGGATLIIFPQASKNYVAEDGTTPYVAEDGTTFYVTES